MACHLFPTAYNGLKGDQPSRRGLRIVARSRFGLDGTMERLLRLPYTLPDEDLREAVDRLARAWAELDRAGGAYSPLIVA